MHDVLIYSKAIELFKENGIEKRISELKEKEELHYIGSHASTQDIISSVNWLKENKYYDFMDKEFKKKYTKTMNGMLNNPENYFWTMDVFTHLSKTPSKEMSVSDMQLFTGDIASIILRPEEMWDYKKFGFDSETGFVSTLSTYIIDKSHNTFSERNYSWITQRNDSKIKTSIERDVHGDFRLFQRDINEYKSFDPFGNEILFRPKFREEGGAIYGYHSVEPSIFVTVLKYANQENIKSEMLENSARKLLDYASSLENRGGNFGEAFGTPRDQSMLYFSCYDIDIPKLKSLTSPNHSIYNIYIEGGGYYSAYIDGKDLIFSKSQNKSPADIITANVRFGPEDIDNLLKGIIYQCANGMGRTHKKEITNLIEYKYSGRYEKDLERYNKTK